MKKATVVVLLALSVVLATGFVLDRRDLMANPGKFVVARLDFAVDLTDAQEKEIRGIIDPVIADLMAERRKSVDANAGELIAKVRTGKLEKADILKAMERRRQFATAHEEKVAETILKVATVLDPGQRDKLASLLQSRLDEFLK